MFKLRSFGTNPNKDSKHYYSIYQYYMPKELLEFRDMIEVAFNYYNIAQLNREWKNYDVDMEKIIKDNPLEIKEGFYQENNNPFIWGVLNPDGYKRGLRCYLVRNEDYSKIALLIHSTNFNCWGYDYIEGFFYYKDGRLQFTTEAKKELKKYHLI